MSKNMQIHKSDAIDWLRSLPPQSVDLVITDPAYESLEKYRSEGSTTRLKNSKSSSNNWFGIFKNDRYPDLFREIFRVLKNNTHFYMFCDHRTMFIVKPLIVSAGFTFKKPLIWDKITIGLGYSYRARYEVIMYVEKGKRKLISNAVPDILCSKRVSNGYPTEKPVSIIKTLVEQSSNVGDIVVDPFFGSGSTCIAATDTDRIFWGCDISDAAHQYLIDRIELAEKQMVLDV